MKLGVRRIEVSSSSASLQLFVLESMASPLSGLIDKLKIFEYTRIYQGPFLFKYYDHFVTIHKCTPGSLGTEPSQRLDTQEG